MEQVKDNLSYHEATSSPSNETELEAVKKVQRIFRSHEPDPLHGLPLLHRPAARRQIAIPDLFAVMNAKQIHRDWNADYYYDNVYTRRRRPGLRLHPAAASAKRSARSTYISATCWRTSPRNLKKRAEHCAQPSFSYFRASTSSARNIPLAGFPPSAHR